MTSGDYYVTFESVESDYLFLMFKSGTVENIQVKLCYRPAVNDTEFSSINIAELFPNITGDLLFKNVTNITSLVDKPAVNDTNPFDGTLANR